MNYEEVLNCINNVLISDLRYDESIDYQLTSYDIEWLEKAKEAVKKQIAIKPKYEEHGILSAGEYHCPKCGSYLASAPSNSVLTFLNPVCHKCGQAIDGSEENEK